MIICHKDDFKKQNGVTYVIPHFFNSCIIKIVFSQAIYNHEFINKRVPDTIIRNPQLDTKLMKPYFLGNILA